MTEREIILAYGQRFCKCGKPLKIGERPDNGVEIYGYCQHCNKDYIIANFNLKKYKEEK